MTGENLSIAALAARKFSFRENFPRATQKCHLRGFFRLYREVSSQEGLGVASLKRSPRMGAHLIEASSHLVFHHQTLQLAS